MKATDEQIAVAEKAIAEELRRAERIDTVPNQSGWKERERASSFTAILDELKALRERVDRAKNFAEILREQIDETSKNATHQETVQNVLASLNGETDYE